ncbi:DUF3592 domain-containing protein [Psychromicrobium sp. YIM B11713]|uniref:DUF3592 domain-containing protein n=1 Tax=Psychromicrobium sp. YIM B11713 TaxID=3145233 RepID=UPI00374E9A6B
MIQLVDGLQLRADQTAELPKPDWQTSNLRRRFSWGASIIVLALGLLFVGGAIGTVISSRPFWGDFVQVSATVTSQRQYYHKGEQCDLGLRFNFRGQVRTTTYDIDNPCQVAPAIGSTVTASVNPNKLSEVLVKGYEGFRTGLPYFFGFFGLVPLAFLIALLKVSRKTYQKNRQLMSTGRWQQLTATVAQPALYRRIGRINLSAADLDGTERIFALGYSHRGPWTKRPLVGETVNFWIISDGTVFVVVSEPGGALAIPCSVQVPNSYQLRAGTW